MKTVNCAVVLAMVFGAAGCAIPAQGEIEGGAGAAVERGTVTDSAGDAHAFGGVNLPKDGQAQRFAGVNMPHDGQAQRFAGVWIGESGAAEFELRADGTCHVKAGECTFTIARQGAAPSYDAPWTITFAGGATLPPVTVVASEDGYLLTTSTPGGDTFIPLWKWSGLVRYQAAGSAQAEAGKGHAAGEPQIAAH